MTELGFENSSSRVTPLVLAEDDSFLTTVITWVLYVVVTPFVIIWEFIRQMWNAFWEYVGVPVLSWIWNTLLPAMIMYLIVYPLYIVFNIVLPWVGHYLVKVPLTWVFETLLPWIFSIIDWIFTWFILWPFNNMILTPVSWTLAHLADLVEFVL